MAAKPSGAHQDGNEWGTVLSLELHLAPGQAMGVGLFPFPELGVLRQALRVSGWLLPAGRVALQPLNSQNALRSTPFSRGCASLSAFNPSPRVLCPFKSFLNDQVRSRG